MSSRQNWFWYYDQAQGMWDIDIHEPEAEAEAEPDAIPIAPYNHRFWPSPRASNMARALGRTGRNNHAKALIFLAERANITVPQLLEITPIAYLEKYAPFENNTYFWYIKSSYLH